MTPEQPNTPEQMGDSLIEKHRDYSNDDVRWNTNAIKSAIISATVARDSHLEQMSSSGIDSRWKYWESVLQELKSRL